jgi:1-acyl-sn-glycerol-3-phosphate acyltransferase
LSRARWTQHAPVAHPGVVTPLARALLVRVLYPIVRVLHRARLEGVEHLPEGTGFLLVGNHPPSLGVAEFGALMALYARRAGAQRPLAGYAHAASFGWWPISWVFRQIGAIPSTYEAAEAALGAGVSVAMFPGGDHEGFRPFWRAREVDLAGRLGFLKIARRARVPVVPMAIVGTTAPLLLGSRLLATLFVWPRVSGVRRMSLSALAILGAAALVVLLPLPLPWAALVACLWVASPLALLPWLPARITIRVGQPIPWAELFPEAPTSGDGDAVLRLALARVQGEIQALVDVGHG